MLTWLRKAFHLTPNRMRRKLLDEAERDLVEVEKWLEYYRAQKPMLQSRIKRLTKELAKEKTQ